MATYRQGAIKATEPAAGDLSAKQFYFMIWSSSNVTTATAVTDACTGVLQNKPAAAGRAAELIVVGPTKVVAGAAISAGALLTTDTSGRAVTVTPGTDTTKYILGRAMEAAGAAGDIIEAFVNCANPARAA